jgi:hypothetical protein
MQWIIVVGEITPVATIYDEDGKRECLKVGESLFGLLVESAG